MKKTKNILTAVLITVLLGSLAGCIVYDRRGGGYPRYDGNRDYHRDHYWDRR